MSILQYSGTIQTAEAAKSILEPVKQMLQTEEPDDWQKVKLRCNFQSYCKRLFEALEKDPNDPPTQFQPYQAKYYDEHQELVLKEIHKFVKDNQMNAEARVVLAMEEVIKVHTEEVPIDALKKPKAKGGYTLEDDLICSQRACKVIEAARADKYVARDIVNGRSITDLARSPRQFLNRKRESLRVNAKKAEVKHNPSQLDTLAPPKTRNPVARRSLRRHDRQIDPHCPQSTVRRATDGQLLSPSSLRKSCRLVLPLTPSYSQHHVNEQFTTPTSSFVSGDRGISEVATNVRSKRKAEYEPLNSITKRLK